MFAYANPDQKQKQQSKAKESMPYQNKNFSTTPNMTGIPGTLKNQFENFSGFSFDDVRVHYHSDKPAQLQARAYTQGNHVYLGSGQEKYLGHELGHVVQQKQGRVSPRLQCMGYAVNNDSCLEKEADSIYEHSIHSPTAPCFSLKITENPTGIVQRQEIISDTNPEDLLYGCTEDRAKYASMMDTINNYFQSHRQNRGQSALQLDKLEYPIIVDYMNNAFLGTGAGKAYGQAETENPDVTGTKKYQDFHHYFCLLMEKKIPQDSSDIAISTRINTACKFGIWLTVKMGHHIHFVLDSIYDGEKQEQIAKGSYQHTAKELRYVRTNWEDEDFQEGLLFYNTQSRVCAPWIFPFDEQWTSYEEETLEIDPMAEYLVNPAKSKDLNDAVFVLQNMSIRIMDGIAEYNTILQEHNDILSEIDNIHEWINNELKQAGCVDTLLSFFGIRENVEERIRPKIALLNVLAEKNLAYIRRLRELQNSLKEGLVIFSQRADFLKEFFAFLDSL